MLTIIIIITINDNDNVIWYSVLSFDLSNELKIYSLFINDYLFIDYD